MGFNYKGGANGFFSKEILKERKKLSYIYSEISL